MGELGQITSKTCPIYLCAPAFQPDIQEAHHHRTRFQDYGWHAIPKDEKTLDTVAILNSEFKLLSSYILERERKAAEWRAKNGNL